MTLLFRRLLAAALFYLAQAKSLLCALTLILMMTLMVILILY